MNSLLRVPSSFAALLLAAVLPSGAVPLRVVPLGDSLTAGVAEDGTAGGYRRPLGALLAREGYEIDFRGSFSDPTDPSFPDGDHQGLGGATVDALRAAVSAWSADWSDPDAILLLAGTNDFWQGAQAEDVVGKIDQLISEIARLCPAASIIVGTLPPRTDDLLRDTRQDTFNALLPGVVERHVAAGRRVRLADLHTVLGADDLSADGVHPNAGGMEKIAGAWDTVFRSVLAPTGAGGPPFLLRAEARGQRQVSLVFSKPVADDAADPSRYTVSDGVSVEAATLDPVGLREVLLGTSPMSAGRVYSVSVSGVRDRGEEARLIAPGSTRLVALPALANGGFEDALEGWTANGNVQVAGADPYRATEGSFLAVFNGGDAPADGSLVQVFPTTPGVVYRFECDIGALGFNDSEQVARVLVEGSAILVDERVGVRAPGSGSTRWTRMVKDFEADAAFVTLRIQDLSPVTGSVDLVVDDVGVTLRGDRTVAVASSPWSGAFISIDPPGMPGAPGGGTAAWVGRFPDGVGATLSAPLLHRGGRFRGWRQHGVSLPGAGSQVAVVVDRDLDLVAEYSENESPVAAGDRHEVVVGKPMLLVPPGVLANDRDPEGAPLRMRVVDQPLHGELLAGADGGFRYVPDLGFQGFDSFSYAAGDGWAESPPVVVTLTARAVADPASGGNVRVRLQGTAVEVSVLTSAAGLHRLQRSRDLVGWEEAGAMDVVPDCLLTFIDPGGRLPWCFYRIVMTGTGGEP